MHSSKPAFTLVEILIVVVILGILAGIAIPNITSVTTVSRETNLKENLSKIRAHIQVYRNEHARFPDAEILGDQLTKPTDFSGDVAAARDTTHRFGPYIEQMPANPFTNLATVRVAAAPTDHLPPGDIDGGWWYNETTGRFHADLSDGYVDEQGNPYNQF